ncbi:MAG: glycosyltransferase family 39 protein, partial [bacterium]
MKKHLLIVILAIALLVRVIHLASLWNTPILDVPIIDSEYYHNWAAKLISDEATDGGVFFMSPLYPYLVSFFYSIFGVSLKFIAVVQVLLGLGVITLIYFIGKRIFGDQAALLSAFIAAVYMPFLYYESLLLSAIVILLLNGGALLCLMAEKHKNLLSFVAGVLAGLSALARPNALLFTVILVVAFLLLPQLGGRKRGVLVFIGVLLVLLPVTYRNYRTSGDWVLITANAGMNFYAGNNPQAEGIYWEAPFVRSAEPQYENLDYRREASLRVGRELDLQASSRYWFHQGFQFIIHQPLSYLKLLLKKFFLFFHDTEIPNNLSIYSVRIFSSLLKYLPFTFGWVAPLGIAWWFLRKRGETKEQKGRRIILDIYVLSYFTSTLIFFAASEYRLPILLVVIPFTADAAVSLLNGSWKMDWKPKLRLLLIAALLAISVNLPTGFTRTLRSPKMDYFNLGSVLLKQSRFAEAAPLLQQSLIYDPYFSEAHCALGD